MSTKTSISSLVFNNFTNDSRVLKEAKSLDKAGYDITIIAHGDEGLNKNEIVDAIAVKRLSFLNRKKASTLQKISAYFKYILQAVKVTKKSDILHCHDLNTMPIAYIVKKLYNKSIKVVYDAHEYETEMNHLSERSKKLMYFFEKRLIKLADKVITVSDSIADEYVKLYPFIEKPSLVLNCPPYRKSTSKKHNIFRERFKIKDDAIIFLYQGSLSKGRGLELILEAFQTISDKKYTLVIMGYGELEEYTKNIANQNTNIFFHEAVSPSVLLNYTSSADIGISTIENTCLSYYYCLPNKMFEYIMAEIPLMVSNLPEMSKVVSQHEIGVILDADSTENIHQAIEKTSALNFDQLSENLRTAKNIYSWENQEKELLKVYKSL